VKRYLTKINGGLFKNIGILSIGTLFSQVIPVAFQPFLRRIYTPEEFGLFSIYFSIVGILIPVAAFRYEQAIVPSSSEEDARRLVSLSMTTGLLFSILIFIGLFFFSNNVSNWLKINPENSQILFFIPAGIFFGMLFQSTNFLAIKQQKFKTSSFGKVIRRLVEVALLLGLGLNNYTKTGLFIGDIGGVFSGTGYFLKQLKFKFDFRKLYQTASDYVDFPKKNMLPTLFNSFALLAPALIINKKFSTEEVGYYDLSRQILALPVALIATSVSQVFLERCASAFHRKEKVLKDFYTISAVLFVLGIIGVLLIYFFGVPLFELFFGEKWALSGKISQLLVFSYAIKFMVSPLSSSLIAFRRLSLVAVWQTLYFLLILALFAVNFELLNDFLILYISIDAVMYLLYWILINYSIKQYENKLGANN
jgi:O-antigen/teichoic acid export membrane protein